MGSGNRLESVQQVAIISCGRIFLLVYMYFTCWKFCHRMYKHTASKKQLYSIAQLTPISFTSQIHLQKRVHFWGIRFVHRGKDGFATAVIFRIPLTPYGNMNPFLEKTNQPQVLMNWKSNQALIRSWQIMVSMLHEKANSWCHLGLNSPNPTALREHGAWHSDSCCWFMIHPTITCKRWRSVDHIKCCFRLVLS